MMNFSGLRRNSFWGRAVRLPLRLIPERLEMPILQGSLKGCRWIVGASNHGCWLGSYEFHKQKLFSETVQAGWVVFDIGAHVGFYTLLAARMVRERGKVLAFEPSPRNLQYLKKHVQINGLTNVQVVETAVGAETGSATFARGPDSSMGALSPRGDLVVSVSTLDALHALGKLPAPNLIKLDIEGGEYLALQGARRLLEECHPVVLLATHGEQIQDQCMYLLKNLGYRVDPIPPYEDEFIATV